MRDEAIQIVSCGTPHAWNLGGWCVPTKALDLYDHIQELSAQLARPLRCLEVGVYHGKSLFVQAVALRDSPHGGFITGVDPYTLEGVAEGFDMNVPEQRLHVDWWRANANLAAAQEICERERLARELGDWCKLVVQTPEDYLRNAGPQHLKYDWIHLDDAHSPTGTLRNAQLLVPLLAPDGVFVVDDVHWPTMQPAMKWIESALRLVSEKASDGMQWAFFQWT